MADETRKATLSDMGVGGEKVHIFEAWCKKCGICVAFCPTGALTSDKDGLPLLTYPEKCTLCGMCELRCPDFAVTVRAREKKESEEEKRK